MIRIHNSLTGEKQELQPLDGPRFLRAEGSISAIDMQPLWWPSTKIVGRYLSPFLAEHLGLATTLAEPPNEAVSVEVALDTRDHATWSAV